MKKQLTEVQIIGFLGQAEASLPVKQLCLRQGFSEGIVNWLRAARSCPVKSTLGLIRSRGHFPKGGYDVPDGATNQESAPTPAV